jgi:hypothetical protein
MMHVPCLKNFVLLAFAAMAMASCIEPFAPALPNQEEGYLVAEGFVNIGQSAVTTIALSRTTKTSVGHQLVSENDATVLIEDENGSTYPLSLSTDGIYQSEPLTLPATTRYRVSILITDSERYYSQFALPIITPEIDSVTWHRINAGVTINLSTHALENDIRYYRWTYEEIWEVTAITPSLFYYKDGTVYPRPDEEVIKMYKCWKYEYPARMVIQSTTALSVDAVTEKPIVVIPVSHQKLAEKYTILITQHALSEEEFNYLSMIEKNTTDLGSFFDPLPFELAGNLYRVNSDDPVVGYIGAYSTSERRIFIYPGEVANWNYWKGCEPPVYVVNHPDSLMKYFGTLGYEPTMSDGPNYIGLLAFCLDCRLRGGSNRRPPFW